MDTASTLVRIYLFICQRYRGRLAAVAQRQSNNADPDFTDEEVLTIYVFGLIKKRSTISEIHEYVEDHFSDWFPDLPSYQSYNRRLNRLSAVFAPLVEETLTEIACKKTRDDIIRIADSMPIMLAKGQRASGAGGGFRSVGLGRLLFLEKHLLSRREAAWREAACRGPAQSRDSPPFFSRPD
jgi:hypothetical protein